MYRDIVLYNCTNELVQLLDKERDFMLKFILYMLLAVVILSGGIFKTFAINYGISKYLSKKPYKGDFEFKKVALHTLKTNYILLALIVLIVLGITLCSASSYINIVENLVDSFKSFQHILAADIESLDEVEGIGEIRARTIKQSLKRMQEQFIFDNLI